MEVTRWHRAWYMRGGVRCTHQGCYPMSGWQAPYVARPRHYYWSFPWPLYPDGPPNVRTEIDIWE